MTDIIYNLERYNDRKIVRLIASTPKLKTKIYSKELNVFLEIRSKPNYKWYHPVPIGVWFLSIVWPDFDKKEFREDYTTNFGGVLYSSTEYIEIKNKIKYLNIPYDVLEHELFHSWQKKKNFMFGLRYGLSKKFRMKMEIEAYIYSYRDKINYETKQHYFDSIVSSITDGEYFANIDEEVVKEEVQKQMRLL